MRIPSLKAMGAVSAVAIAAGLSLAACGSEEEAPPPKTVPAVSASTANQLAERSERIAEQLDSGDVCGAAHSADELDGAVAEAEVSAELRAELESATERLVNSVNCPPPPEPEKKEKDKDDKDEDGESDSGPPPPEGDLPPGLRKKLQEMGDQYEDARLP
jgi:hypothetical protein